MQEMQTCAPDFISKACIKMRQKMAFLQLQVRIYGSSELESQTAWTNFIQNDSPKISAGNLNAVVVLIGNGPSQINFVVITKEKICNLRFCKDESQVK